MRGPVGDLVFKHFGDAVVVGSAVVNQIARHGKSPELVKHVGAFVKLLVRAVKAL